LSYYYEDLTEQDISDLILEILSQKRILQSNQLQRVVIFKHPTAKEKLLLNCAEKQKIELYFKEGYIKEDEITEDLISDFFTLEEQEELELVQNKIKGYKLILNKRIKGSSEYLKDLNTLNELKGKEDTLLYKKDQVKQVTVEYKAKEDKYIELLSFCTLDTEENRIWNNSEELLNSFSSINQFYKFLNLYLDFYFGFDTKIIRKIARSGQWRNYYSTAEKGILKLFDQRSEDLSIDQLHLISWSNYYSNINEISLKDRPDQALLEDDAKLDAYLQAYIKKVEAEVKVSSMRSKSKAMDKDHVIVTAESSNYVELHKNDLYSDTSTITGRSKGQNSNVYDEKKEILAKKAKGRRTPEWLRKA
jgi:hypothetical protein